MLHQIKRQRQIENIYKSYKIGMTSAESAEKSLVGKCHVNCLICKNAFFRDEWCSTMPIDNCMYFEKSKSNLYPTNVRYVDEEQVFKRHVEKARLIQREKGFATVSMLQRKLRVTNKVACKVLESIQ